MTDRHGARAVTQAPLSPPLRMLLSIQIVLVLVYPLLLLGMATILSIGVTIRQFAEPFWEILVLLPVAGGLWGSQALITLLFHTLIRPNNFYAVDKLGLAAGVISCLLVIGAGYDSLFIWLVFALPIIAALELVWLRQQLSSHAN